LATRLALGRDMRNRKDSRNQMRDFAAEISAALVQAREFVVPNGTQFPLLSLGDVLTYGAVMA
jgi:hypothetical protein